MTQPLPDLSVGVWHKDGPLAQIRRMADWADPDIGLALPSPETLRKIAANLRAASDALDERQSDEPVR